MDNLENLNPKVYTLTAIIVGFLLINDYNTYEQNAIGNWFMLVGQLLESNAAQQQNIESKIYGNPININSNINKCFYDPLFFDIDKIKKILNETQKNNSGNVINELQSAIKKINEYLNEIKGNN